eukprot:TRINITY_DN21069_c0_g1_i2.p1 TRINITY_DN21069_c0_g1~~TRINITY_DN21069_c0_g1_i2.p1  ORF type:complete len:432 (+),score=62.77 TRINITY_DN21069_c0_g1_i2:2-1297(+)
MRRVEQQPQRGFIGRQYSFDVDGVVRGQPTKALVVPLGPTNFEVVSKNTAAPTSNTDSVEQEVAAVVNRMVHWVAFDQSTKNNAMLLRELEDFQHSCWDRERELENKNPGGVKKKPTPSSVPSTTTTTSTTTTHKRSNSKRGRDRKSSSSPELTLADALAINLQQQNQPNRKGTSPRDTPKRRTAKNSSMHNTQHQGTPFGVTLPSECKSLDESLMLVPYNSVHKVHPTKGLQCLTKIPSSFSTATRPDMQGPSGSSFGVLLTAGYMASDPNADAFVKRLSEIQYLAAETVRQERSKQNKQANSNPNNPTSLSNLVNSFNPVASNLAPTMAFTYSSSGGGGSSNHHFHSNHNHQQTPIGIVDYSNPSSSGNTTTPTNHPPTYSFPTLGDAFVPPTQHHELMLKHSDEADLSSDDELHEAPQHKAGHHSVVR